MTEVRPPQRSVYKNEIIKSDFVRPPSQMENSLYTERQKVCNTNGERGRVARPGGKCRAYSLRDHLLRLLVLRGDALE